MVMCFDEHDLSLDTVLSPCHHFRTWNCFHCLMQGQKCACLVGHVRKR